MKATTQTLKQLQTTVIAEKTESHWKLQVIIAKLNGTPPIKYDEISVRGKDDRGKEFHFRKLDQTEQMFIEISGAGTTATGFYVMELEGARRPASVEVTRGGEKQSFKLRDSK